MPARRGRQLLGVFLVIVAIGVAVYVAANLGRPAPAPIPGMVRQTEIRIAPEITGRLASILVSPGQHVHKGEVLAVLDNPDLAASLEEAKAAAASARAERAHVFAGVRAEEVAMAADDVSRAQAQLMLAKAENYRSVTLAQKNFESHQSLDESNAGLAKAQADLDLKQAQYAQAKAGPIAEERALSQAQVALAEAAIADLEAAFTKTKLTAPADGTIGIRVAEQGEIMAPGKPVLTMDVDGQHWFAFTLREDRLQGLAIGTTVKVVDASGKSREARVTELRPLGEFAVHRAARAVGDHDLNSFQLRLDPLSAGEDLEPGMTVWLPPRP